MMNFLHQSDSAYRGDEVGEQVTKTYCLYDAYNPLNNYYSNSKYSPYRFTKILKQELGFIYWIDEEGDTFENDIFDSLEDSYLKDSDLEDSEKRVSSYLKDRVSRYLKDREEQEHNLIVEEEYEREEYDESRLPHFHYSFEPSSPIQNLPEYNRSTLNIDAFNKVKPIMREQTSIIHGALISLSDTIFYWRNVIMVPKVSLLPYPLMSELYDRADRFLYGQLVDKTFNEKTKENERLTKNNHLIEGILKFSRTTMPYYVGNLLWDVFNVDETSSEFFFVE
jgi:hypothetical protein